MVQIKETKEEQKTRSKRDKKPNRLIFDDFNGVSNQSFDDSLEKKTTKKKEYMVGRKKLKLSDGAEYYRNGPVFDDGKYCICRKGHDGV